MACGAGQTFETAASRKNECCWGAHSQQKCSYNLEKILKTIVIVIATKVYWTNILLAPG